MKLATRPQKGRNISNWSVTKCVFPKIINSYIHFKKISANMWFLPVTLKYSCVEVFNFQFSQLLLKNLIFNSKKSCYFQKWHESIQFSPATSAEGAKQAFALSLSLSQLQILLFHKSLSILRLRSFSQTVDFLLQKLANKPQIKNKKEAFMQRKHFA